MLAHFEDQGRNAGTLVETRDHRRAGRRSKHVSSLSQVLAGIEAKAVRAGSFCGVENHTEEAPLDFLLMMSHLHVED